MRRTVLRRTAAVGILALAAAVAAPDRADAQTAPAAYAALDEGVHALVVRLTVKPDRVDEFLSAMKGRIRESRTDAAVVDFRILATNDPAVFTGFESFRSKTAFEAFAKSPGSAAFLERIKGLLARPPEVDVLKPLP